MNNQFNNSNGENLNNNINNLNIGQPMNSPQPVNPNMAQPMNNPQPVNLNMAQLMNNPQPVNSNMGQPMGNPQYNTIPNNQNNNKTVLIIAISAFIIIAIVIALVVIIPMLTKEDNKDNVNEYEENNSSIVNPNTSPSSEPNITQSNTITYNGFEFTKIPGYEYEIDEDMLVIGNDSYAFVLSLYAQNMSSLRQNSNQVKEIFQDKGYIVGQVKDEYYSGTEVITYELTQTNENCFYYFIPTSSSSYVFQGLIATRSNTFDYDTINTLVSIVRNAQLKGSAFNYSTEFGTGIDFSKIEVGQ